MNRFDIVQRAEGDEESQQLLSTIGQEKKSDANVYQQMSAEAVSSLFLAAAVAMGSDAMGVGMMVAVLVFAFGHVSGAHINPAVTLAVYIRGKINVVRAALYIVAQVAGAFVGALVPMYVLDDKTITFPKRGVDDVMRVLVVETVFTLLIATVVLNVATTKAQAGNSFFGLAIGFAVTAAAKSGAYISGGAFNPAVGLALPVIAEHYDDIWIYAVGPLLGGALAGGLFLLVTPAKEF